MEKRDPNESHRIRNREATPIPITMFIWGIRVMLLGALVHGTQIVRTLIKKSAHDDLSIVCEHLSRLESPPQIVLENTYRAFNLNDGSIGFICGKVLAEKRKDKVAE